MTCPATWSSVVAVLRLQAVAQAWESLRELRRQRQAGLGPAERAASSKRLTIGGEDEEGGDDKVDEVEFAALYRQLLAIVQQKDGD